MPFDGTLTEQPVTRGIFATLLDTVFGRTEKHEPILTTVDKLKIMDDILAHQNDFDQMGFNTCLWHGMQNNQQLIAAGLYKNHSPLPMKAVTDFLPVDRYTWAYLFGTDPVAKKRIIIANLIEREHSKLHMPV